MKYYFVVGERSGDLHSSNLIKKLIELDDNAQIRGMGGELMQNAGAVIVKDYSEVAFMGFLEVFINLRTIMVKLKEIKQDILNFNPDVLVLVDFAGFNLKIAAFAKKNNLKVFYYISPKIWAWNQKRANKIKSLVDKMFVILPFEKEFYKSFNFQVDFVGNPIFDAIRSFVPESTFLNDIKTDKPIIALLPGSRRQEVESMLSVMQNIAIEFPAYKFVIAGVSNLPKEIYTKNFNSENSLVIDKTYDLLSIASAAIVTSGTATLETALFNVPQVVVYKTSYITYKIAKALIKVKYISLVNLIAGKEIVKELIQEKYSSKSLKAELFKLLEDKKYMEKQTKGYEEIKALFGNDSASYKTAKLMIQYLQDN